jgi:hypothetical protein
MPKDEKIRLNMEWMDYTMSTHYGWSLQDVHALSLSEARQAFSWAMAMNQKGSVPDEGEVVRLGYDRVPPLR